MKSGINVIIADQFNETDSYITRRPHGHREWHWLVTYTLAGEGYFVTEQSDRHYCKAGDLTLLRSEVAHQYGTVRGKTWQFLWAHFYRLPETAYFPNSDLIICPLEAGHLRRRVHRAFKKVIQHSREQTGLWMELCENALSELLLLIAERQNQTMDPRVEQVLRLLTLKMCEHVKLGELASAVGLSASRLSHLFKAETGQSIVHALTLMRLRQAALLLEHTDRTATEAAYEVGFQNYNYFAVQFQKHYGVSPRTYKQSFR